MRVRLPSTPSFVRAPLKPDPFPAIRAVKDMVRATDFDRKMLLLATQLAHDANLKTLLLTVLDSLLGFLQSQGGFDSEVEALTMVRYVPRLWETLIEIIHDVENRCIIRLVLDLLKQPAADLLSGLFLVLWPSPNTHRRNNLVPTLIRHFKTGMSRSH